MPKPYPVGKAQQIILDALGRDVESFQEAEKIFADLRIIVTPVRQGHDSVPHVSLNHLQGVTVDNLNEMREINEPYSSELVKIVQIIHSDTLQMIKAHMWNAIMALSHRCYNDTKICKDFFCFL